MGREKYGTSPMGIFPYMRYACMRVRRRDIYHPIIKTQVMTIRTFSITRRVLFIEKRDLYYLLLHAVADHCAKSVNITISKQRCKNKQIPVYKTQNFQVSVTVQKKALTLV